MRNIFIALVLILSLAASGCEWLAPFAEPLEQSLQEQGIDVDLDKVNVSWQEAEETSEENTNNPDLPEGWPAELAVYPDAEILESYTKISRGVTTSYLELATPDSPHTVRDFYRGVVVAAGFQIDSVEGFTIRALNETQTLQVVAELQGDRTIIELTLTY